MPICVRAAFVSDPIMDRDEVVPVKFQFLSTTISAGALRTFFDRRQPIYVLFGD